MQHVESIKEVIDRGIILTLAEIRDAINNGDGELLVSNKEIKLRVL